MIIKEEPSAIVGLTGLVTCIIAELEQSKVLVGFEPGIVYVSVNVIVIFVPLTNPCGLTVTIDPLPPKAPELAVRVCEDPRTLVNC